MATRGDIRDAFTAELKAIAGTHDVTDENGNVVDTVTLDADDGISLRNPEPAESYPRVVYHDNYRPQEYNGVGTGPDDILYNDDGSVDAAIYREYVIGQFIVDVRASREDHKEPIYEALHTQFARYEQTPWNVSDLHEDVVDVGVQDRNTSDGDDAEQTIRGDQLEIQIEFHRNYEFSTDNIDQINFDVDADSDGSADSNYTIT